MCDGIGSWRPLAPFSMPSPGFQFAFSPLGQLWKLHATDHFVYLLLELLLEFLSYLRSRRRMSAEELPRFLLLVLEALSLLRLFSPADSLSPKVLKIVGPHRGFVLLGCFLSARG